MKTKRTTPKHEATHERIVSAASRAIRRNGYAGAGVADIMKEAGLTHGGFYSHFSSREALLAEAADCAGGESVALFTRISAAKPSKEALRTLVETYLSKEHVEAVETGCAVAALGSETPRQASEVRHALTCRTKEFIDLISRQFPDWGKPAAHERATVMVATLVGALIIARAVNDPKFSEAVRVAALKHLTSANP